MKNRIVLILLVFFGAYFEYVVAQTIPVGIPLLENYYRRLQINGELDSSVSFSIRPLFPVSAFKLKNTYNMDSLNSDSSELKWNGKKYFSKNRGVLQILPISVEQSFNSHHPYGWNDGSMIPVKGYQARVSGGIYAKYGPVSIQLRPEFVRAANPSFEGFNTEHADIVWSTYYNTYLNRADIPERFGEDTYTRVDWGQSSLRFTINPMSIGLSNENLWWGPGRRNSLLMTNNAPGFKHLTLNTSEPIKTFFGSFEAQIIAGRLEDSGYLPPEPNRVAFENTLFKTKTDNWRYLSGVVFTYQPKWTPGLSLGFARSLQMYSKGIKGKLGDYLPFLQPFQKKNTQEDSRERDQLASVFARYLLTASKAEIYFEYGRNDHNEDLRDFLLDPEHARAYVAGFTKLFLVGAANQLLEVNLEVTQLSQPTTSLLRDAGSWYVHWQVRHGYTHKGQVLGAGIGPGSNLQSLTVNWSKGFKGIGIQLERYIHNNDFYVYAFAHNQDFRKKWVDLSATGTFEWDYKNLLINARASVIRSLNYQYWLIDRPWEGIYFQAGHDVFNFQGHLGLTYRF